MNLVRHREIQPDNNKAFTVEERATLDAAKSILRKRAGSHIPLQSWQMLNDYLALTAFTERVEVFRVLFLNRKNQLIRDKVMQRGSIDHVAVYVTEIIRSAVLLDASAMILCHNHPSGDPSPSQDDIDLTQRIIGACKILGLTVHDHVIVGFGREDNTFSMKSAGLMATR